MRYCPPIGPPSPPNCDCLEMRDVTRPAQTGGQAGDPLLVGEEPLHLAGQVQVLPCWLQPVSHRARRPTLTHCLGLLRIFFKLQVVVVVGGTRAVLPPPMFNTCICNNIIMVVRLNTGLPSPLPPPPSQHGRVATSWISSSHSTGGRALVPTRP